MYVKINYLNIKIKYLLQIYTFKYNETRTKGTLKEEETSLFRDRRANKRMHMYHPSIYDLIDMIIRWSSSYSAERRLYFSWR